MKKSSVILFVTLLISAACGPRIVPADIGKVWHEKEGPWEGTWSRRGDTNVFDAVWTNPQGEKIEDQVVFESVSDHQIVLFRKGTQGRYRGHLSEDGLKVDSGSADWFSPGDSWSATIEK